MNVNHKQEANSAHKNMNRHKPQLRLRNWKNRGYAEKENVSNVMAEEEKRKFRKSRNTPQYAEFAEMQHLRCEGKAINTYIYIIRD